MLYKKNMYKIIDRLCKKWLTWYHIDKIGKEDIPMTKEDIIISNAHDLLNHHTVTEAPINVIEICKAWGISIFEDDFGYVENDLGSDKNKVAFTIAGAIITSPSQKAIYVRKSDSYFKKKFTIAHELGHYFLQHREKSKTEEVVTVSFSGDRNPEEQKMDVFASELLMPENMVRDYHKGKVFALLWEIADYFKVSELDMKNRLNKLGIRYLEV